MQTGADVRWCDPGGGLHCNVLPYCCLIACWLRVCAATVNKGQGFTAAQDLNVSRLVGKQLATKPGYSKATALSLKHFKPRNTPKRQIGGHPTT